MSITGHVRIVDRHRTGFNEARADSPGKSVAIVPVPRRITGGTGFNEARADSPGKCRSTETQSITVSTARFNEARADSPGK